MSRKYGIMSRIYHEETKEVTKEVYYIITRSIVKRARRQRPPRCRYVPISYKGEILQNGNVLLTVKWEKL